MVIALVAGTVGEMDGEVAGDAEPLSQVTCEIQRQCLPLFRSCKLMRQGKPELPRNHRVGASVCLLRGVPQLRAGWLPSVRTRRHHQ